MSGFEKLTEKLKNFATTIHSTDPEANRKKQLIIQGAVASIFIAGVFYFIVGDDSSTKKSTATPVATAPKLIDDVSGAQTNYVTTVAPKIDAAMQQLQTVAKSEAQRQSEFEELKKRLEDMEKGKTQSGTVDEKATNIGKALNFKPDNVPPLAQNDFKSVQQQPVNVQQEQKNTLVFSQEKQAAVDAKKEADRPYIPTGAFTRAVILQGINAPTMTKAKSNPLPVLLRLTDLSIIPNKKKFDLKECFILGEGYGELASERVHIRTTTLSCVTNNWKNIDMPIKGYVVGSDGISGVAGEVVSKQGAMLARTIVAGFLQGVGSAFGQSGQTLLSSPLGTTTAQPTDTGTIARSGAYQGASKAAEKLADFYMKMADTIEPVIEVPGGKKVTIVISAGATLEPRQKDKVNTTNNTTKEEQH